MFISCRGLKVLVEMMDENYDEQKDLVWMAVDGICRVFELQASFSDGFAQNLAAIYQNQDPFRLTECNIILLQLTLHLFDHNTKGFLKF